MAATKPSTTKKRVTQEELRLRLRVLELTVERHKVYFKILGVIAGTALTAAASIIIKLICG